MEEQTIYICLAAAFGLFMAWGIGANDVANAMERLLVPRRSQSNRLFS